MTESSGAAAETLNELIQTCKDAEHGYQSAALLVHDLNLRRLFESYAQQRTEFAAELQLEVRRLATDPVNSGHATAALQRTWGEFKAGVAGTDEGEVIAEREHEEDLAVGRYEEALNSGLPEDLRSLVERQYLEVKQAHEHMCSLENAHSRNS